MRKSDAITWAGSMAELSRVLGISYEAVRVWGDEVPEGRAYQIEVLSQGVLKASMPPSHKTDKKVKAA